MASSPLSLAYEHEDVEHVKAFVKRGYRTRPVLFVNGEKVPDKWASQARPNQTLLTFLRDVMGLKGSKLGCAEGGCGACTVMISKAVASKSDDEEHKIKHYAVNACLMPVLAADGCHVTTVEFIGSVKFISSNQKLQEKSLHPVQTAMVDLHGSQCGFCTPGIIVSIYALLANQPTVDYIEEHMDGNLCRCTGYRPIWDAARSVCEDALAVADTIATQAEQKSCADDCPRRDVCQKDCDKTTTTTEGEEKKDSKRIVSSTVDKLKTYKETFLADEHWREQPDRFFPLELLDATSVECVELQKPLMIVDPTTTNNNDDHGSSTWFQPNTLTGLLELLQQFAKQDDPSSCKMIVGNTEVGIETKFKHAVYRRLIYPSESIPELYSISTTTSTNLLSIGSCCPLSTIMDKCKTLGSSSSSETTKGLQRTVLPIHDMLRWFASTQIRNVACLGGNVVTASPISDMNPMLLSMGANLILSSMEEPAAGDQEQTTTNIRRRTVPVSEFFLKYRVVDLKPFEVLERIDVPVLQPLFEYLYPFKQARRREDDISICTSGMRIRLKVVDGSYIIDDIALAFGGMAIKAILALDTMKEMVGKEFCAATFQHGMDCLLKELSLPEVVPGGQAAYRMTLATSFLYKFFLSCVKDLQADVEAIRQNPSAYPADVLAAALTTTTTTVENLPDAPVIDEKEVTGTYNFLREKKPQYSGVQRYAAPPAKLTKGAEDDYYPPVKDDFPKAEASTVGKPATHASAALHCTGEAVYADDMPPPPGTLYGALLLSNQCGVVFEGFDKGEALHLPGIQAVFTSEDIERLGGRNAHGPVVVDEFIFFPVGEKIRTVGQILGIVVAETQELAELGARLVKVQYGAESTEKIVVSIDDAIEANSFYEATRHGLHRGDVALLDNLAATPDSTGTPKVGDIVKVSGTFKSGGQDHFYLETGSTLVVPSDADTNLTIYCSTQAATKTQMACAAVTNTPASKVVCRVKRLGGGFGGKETRTISATACAAVAAKLLCRPVRLTLSREVDMKTTGARHAFMTKYTASAQITEDGGAKLVSLDVKLYNNAGWAHDLSGPVMDRALFHIDGVYLYPNFRCEGVSCRTVQPNHTAFRGFGGPQGMAAAEHIIDHLAAACHVPVDTFRKSNMYKEGDTLHFGTVLCDQDGGRWNVPHMWDRLYNELDIPHRREHIKEFNAKNKWVKRGLALIPTKFGVAFTVTFMNQGGALVHLYTDGTVLVSHGGTEMGQGLHTKVCMVAAQAFGIPLKDVYVNETATDKVAMSIPTAASMSTDLYGMATLDACRQILKRLEPIRETLGPNASLAEVAKAAHFARVDLTAHGFHKVKDERIGFDWTKPKPDDYPEDKPVNSWKGHPFNYFTQGVACSEVEVDLLSGNHRTLRSDVLVDVGSSINPMIDIGQIEGAFTQGMGWSTTEDVVYADDDHTWIRPRGSVFATGPGTYKIPAFNDQPEVFNVSILEDVDNPFTVHSSKAVGEPPLFLGTSVYFAIRDALHAARKENTGTDTYLPMHLPMNSERIRMYAGDVLSKKAVTHLLGKEEEEYQPQGSC